MLKPNEKYKIYDDFCGISNYQKMWKYVQDAKYIHGEVDHQGSYPIGMVHELPLDCDFGYPSGLDGISYKYINFPFPREINGYPLVRAYVNFYAPRELAVFHIDDNDPKSTTLLYYPCPTLDPDEGGATELMIDDNLIGVRSIANRLLAFKSNILHRSTPFTNYPRWTIALKYNKFITHEDVRAREI